MGRPVGSQNFESRPDKDCTQRLELDTELSIRRICREFGIPATRFFELSDLNSPRHPRPLSYSRFAQAMAGMPISEEHNAVISRAVFMVRQELRRLGTKPVRVELIALTSAVLAAAEDDPDILPRKELNALRAILRRAAKHLPTPVDQSFP